MSPRQALPCTLPVQSNPLLSTVSLCTTHTSWLRFREVRYLGEDHPACRRRSWALNSGLWLLAPALNSLPLYISQHLLSVPQTVAECVLYYYLTKKNENYKSLVRRSYRRRGKSQVRGGVCWLTLGPGSLCSRDTCWVASVPHDWNHIVPSIGSLCGI